MNFVEKEKEVSAKALSVSAIAMKLEVIVIPVSNVDRARRFYSQLDWRLDIDYREDDNYRVVQFTPSGSECSVIFGKNVTKALPGSVQGLHLIVSDIEAARADLLRRGIAISESFHDSGGIFHHANGLGLIGGPNPQRKSYASFASFRDPDGNGWVLQEVTARLTGHTGPTDTGFTPEIMNVVGHSAAEEVPLSDGRCRAREQSSSSRLAKGTA